MKLDAFQDEGPTASRFIFTAPVPELEEFLHDARSLRPSRANAPDVWRCTWSGRHAFVKSYHHCSAIYRQTVGRIAMNREWWALQRLAQSGRAPQPLARPFPWVVVMEWVNGTPLESLQRGQIPAARLVAEAEGLLDDMARVGVVHADLGHDHWSAWGRESNLLADPAGRLVAIDFAGCWAAGGPTRPWRRLAQALQQHDQLLITKLLYHFGDKSVAGHPGWSFPAGRGLAWWDLMQLLGKI